MTVRYHDPAEMVAWAAARISGNYGLDAQAIGVEHGAELRAVAVFDTFRRRNCNISIVAAPGPFWFTKEFARAVCAYVFITCDKPRVTCHVPAERPDIGRFAVQMGCQLEGLMRANEADGGDTQIYGLLRRDCDRRWLPRGLALSGLGKSAATG